MLERSARERVTDFFTTTLPEAFGFDTDGLDKLEQSPLRAAMLQNAPVVVAANAEDEARQLLEAAAEVEHALLVQYLYAAFSVQNASARKTLINIAVQEMSHLIAVQNLLLFLGANPYFERQDVSPDPELDPFPFELLGYKDKGTLERFVLAEMPVLKTLEEEDQEVIKNIQTRIDPDGKFNRVGVLYGRIYWLFQTTSQAEGPWKDVSNIGDIGQLTPWHISNFKGADSVLKTQASRDETGPRLGSGTDTGEIWWQDYSREGAFRTIDTREAALLAIYEIAVQGEGLAETAEPATDSHFHIFFNALKKHDGLDPDEFNVVPANPGLAKVPGRTEITDPLAVALCRLFDNRYQIMLVSLTAALLCGRTEVAENTQRQNRVYWAFFEMKHSLLTIASKIILQPCKAGGHNADLCAAPIFDLGDVDLTSKLQALEEESRRLHIRAKELTLSLKAFGFGVNDDFLEKIEKTDHERYPDI
ncbi:ferritin-like domain-containing protein [Rhizobium leguminosarum]